MKPSVVIIGSRGYPSYYGGFETLVRHLAPYLADWGWDVAVYGRRRDLEEFAETDRRVEQIHTRGIESRSLSTLTFGATATANAARRAPDVALVLNVANGFWLPLLRSRSIPTVVNVDGIEWERDKWGALAKTTFRAGARMTATFADHLICDAHEIDAYWQNVMGRGGTYIPYGATAPERLPPPPELEGRPYVLMVARFVPENTVGEFIAAVDELSAECDVVIVGSSGYGGPIEDSVRALRDRNPRVQWFGHISDDRRLFALWQNAAVYFHGHSVGGTNPALVQAMACGAPIVARDTVFNREVLADAAVFCQPTPTAIAAELSAVIHDHQTREFLGARAAERARTSFTWDSVCSAYEAILAKAAGRDAAR
ncbi:glycosyltransferase [Williamsia sp.]|uniref:glycosyltransferase n=1 Tax=Williamsia sp. TaxID=1872085 RepID=UPI001A1964AC|nr:glycosyltransferase [Williamsia sp.]MBJ7289753.1 DUF1972 domain-containing protein [Williamsia sp.]